MITTGMYTPDIMVMGCFKAYYTDAKEIGDESVPGLLYHVEANQWAVCGSSCESI